MNEPSNQGTGGFGDTFSSQPAAGAGGTNPFTADLKGEFTSNFGTNTNAVSQIFKEGGFVNGDKKKMYLIGGVVFLVVALLLFAFWPSEDGEIPGEDGDDPVAADPKDPEDGDTPVASTKPPTATAAATATGTEEAEDEPEADGKGEEDTATTASNPGPSAVPHSKSSGGGGGSGPLSLNEPADGSSLTYDETAGAAMFTWTGGGGHIVFSRNQSMNPTVFRIKVSGNEYAFHSPWPGQWYWKVENGSGSTEVRGFKVNGPARRSLQITSGASLAGNGGVVSWQGDGAVAYYRVEFSSGSWAAPAARFATSGNSVQLQGVAPGSYQMRVGAFSEVSGRFEYTSPMAVTVQ